MYMMSIWNFIEMINVMKMRKSLYFVNILLLVIFTACVKKVETETLGKKPAQAKRNNVTQRFLGTEYSKYFNYLLKDAPLIAYSLGTTHQLEEADFFIINDLETVDSDEVAPMKSKSGKAWQVSANDVVLTNRHEYRGTTKRANVLSYETQLYGKEVTFSFNSEGDYSSSPAGNDCDAFEFSLQVPQRIYITSPRASECDRIPLCYFEELQVCWNPDFSNEIGVVIMVEWKGVLIQEETQDEYVRSIDIVEDIGCAVLDNEMFDGMPDGALVTLTLLRGDIIVVEAGEDCPWEEMVDPFINRMENDSIFAGEACRIAAETHASMPMILVRELP